MNTLYIGGFDLPDKNAAAHRVMANAKALRELGWNVTLVGLDKSASSFLFDGFQCNNLEYPANMIGWVTYVTTLKNYLPYLEDIHPQLVIAYNHPAFALNKLVSYCKERGIKVVSDCTEWYTPEGNAIKKAIKGWDTQKRMTDVHLRMDGVISISRYLHEYYSKRGVKSLLLPPLVDIQSEKWSIINDSRLEEPNEIVLTYAGSPGHKDALDRLVSIVSELAEHFRIRFEVIGLNREQFIKVYDYKREISKSIHFNGRLSHEDTLKLLSSSDFQIFIREDNITTKAGFPTKFVESISAGVPVLTNLTSNIGDYLSTGLNGYPLDVTSDDALKLSLVSVFQQSRESINAVKHRINRNTFDYRNYISQIQQFLNQL